MLIVAPYNAQEDGDQAMMEYKRYLAKVDIDGNELYGTVVNLHHDHVDSRATTAEAIRQAFHESVDFYLDGYSQDGEEPERPFSGRAVVRLPAHTHRAPLPGSRRRVGGSRGS